MQETDRLQAQASYQCIYEGIAQELRGAGFQGITLLLIRDVHRDMLRGRPPSDMVGRMVVCGLQERLGP